MVAEVQLQLRTHAQQVVHHGADGGALRGLQLAPVRVSVAPLNFLQMAESTLQETPARAGGGQQRRPAGPGRGAARFLLQTSGFRIWLFRGLGITEERAFHSR